MSCVHDALHGALFLESWFWEGCIVDSHAFFYDFNSRLIFELLGVFAHVGE